MTRHFSVTAAFLVVAQFSLAAHAATWQITLPPSVAAPTVEIAPLKYGKSWAYAIEIDDNPASTIEVSQPLLAQYQWSDAPAGQTGGTLRPFVGTAAVTFAGTDVGKPVNLTYAQIDSLKRSGWGVANHSYWHSGNHWDKSQFLKPEEFRRELFWSQVVYAELVGGGRGATHFVFPNGDYHYGPYMKEFGLQSASRVGSSSSRNLFDAKANLLDWTRAYLDEGVWAKNGNALADFPEKPALNDFIIDFTHGMSADAGVKNGTLSVEVPDEVPGSALTLKIGGVPANATLQAPAGGALFRQGKTLWLTTPVIGKAGAKPVADIHRIYEGEVKTVTWDKPVSLAGVRLMQMGGVSKEYVLRIEAVAPDGTVQSIVPAGKETMPAR
ncbi:MAG TPA: hypothetical protein VF681_14785 [Abditibacteriaceae bacterium]|jgi:hypothetical protein